MFNILSKTLFYLLMPAVWIASGMLFSLFAKKNKIKRRVLITTIILFFLFSNTFLINEILTVWEYQPVPINELKDYTTAIVLTGVTDTNKKPHDRVYFGKGADRVLHTVQLYKEKKIQKIIITGGHGRVVGEKIAEAPLLKKVFVLCGVNENDIYIEDKSFNTLENAFFTKKMIDSLHIPGKYLLVTSAFHMRRAHGCFTKAGIATDPFPVDYLSGERKFTPDYIIIPSEGAFFKWGVMIHEWLGYITYKIMGYC